MPQKSRTQKNGKELSLRDRADLWLMRRNLKRSQESSKRIDAEIERLSWNTLEDPMALGEDLEAALSFLESAAMPVRKAEDSRSGGASRSSTNKKIRLPQKKQDYSQHFIGLTEKQKEIASLSYEYGMEPSKIAKYLGKDRKTIHEHLDAAKKRIEMGSQRDKWQKNRSKSEPGWKEQ
jgi:DNA-directed RNA polymerase specialized sigma24 family protein